jgi:ribosomal protein S18 acetylase RimI-like enzyme
MIEFRTAALEDAKDIAKLVNSAYRGNHSRLGWTTEADYLDGQRTDEEAIKELILTPNNQIELAVEEKTKKIVGSIHLKIEFPETLYFGMLTVEPSIQNQGLGKKLIQHTEEKAKANKFKKIRFTVIPQRHELIAFYERRGYKETGRFEEFPSHDPRYGLPKVLGLILKEYQKDLSL